MLPKVSIIIPVYNGANYMREAIDSALAQTYKNIEIIVINDGSRDNGETERIALSYGDKIRYFSKENGGCASALNVGINNMQGEYFSWLSHDDIYLPNKVEHQINILNKLSNKDIILYCGYELIDKKSSSLYFVRPDERYSKEKLDIPLFSLLRGLIHGCTLLIPSKYFNEVGLFDEALKHTQDYDLWFKLFRIVPLYFDSEVLIKSREHPEQSTRVVPNQLEECEVLWSGFLKKLTKEEMIRIDGSTHEFLYHSAAFLKQTGYIKSYKIALSMREQELTKVKISIIMPVYNSIDFAIKAIESVLAQTHENFELIVIDDGSTEDTTKLHEICNKDSRITHIYQENKGSAAARNCGIDKATGYYTAFLDANDLFKPNKLEYQLRFMAENSFKFSHTSYKRIDLNDKFVEEVPSGTFLGKIFPKIIYYNPVATSTIMVKTSLLKLNMFPENVMVGEDHCLWITLSSKNLLGGINSKLSEIRVDTSLEKHMILKKESLRTINVAAFIANDKYLSEFSSILIYSLSKAIKHLKYLKKKGIIGIVLIEDDYNPLKIRFLPPVIAATIHSLKKHGIRTTIIKIYRWIRKRLK
ncbi:MAG TPA: glycosyltransferase [Rickettsia endosymbiont of Omalisus fontisbellaquei]|nr:glycosyltransferase [Rickettsia endosymbiont of Omalisus fontisbellaquei]